MEYVDTSGAPYGILNFDALWWVVLSVLVIVIAAFYGITYALTKPLKGDPESIFFKKTRYRKRSNFISEASTIEDLLASGDYSAEDATSEIHKLTISFLQTKTKTNITGYSYAKLAENGAPSDLLEVISQTYYILYNPISENEKSYRVPILIKDFKKVVSRWR